MIFMKVLKKSKEMKTLSCLFIIFVIGCTNVDKPDNLQPKFSNVKSVRGGKVSRIGDQNPVRIDKRYQAFKGEVEYRQLDVEGDWIGGSEVNPVFYTRKAERIYSLGKDIYVYPVTILSINKEGKVIYPEDGIQLTGDMQTVHFLSLVAKLGKKASAANLRFHADSNFPDKPAKVIDLKTNKIIAKYIMTNGDWYEVR